MCAKIRLSGFFGQVFLLEVIKSSCLLVKKLTLLVTQGGQNQGGQLLYPMFLCDRALKMHVGMGSDSKICLILSYKS